MDSFTGKLLALVKQDQVFYDFIACDFKRQSLEIFYGYRNSYDLFGLDCSRSLIDILDFKDKANYRRNETKKHSPCALEFLKLFVVNIDKIDEIQIEKLINESDRTIDP